MGKRHTSGRLCHLEGPAGRHQRCRGTSSLLVAFSPLWAVRPRTLFLFFLLLLLQIRKGLAKGLRCTLQLA